MIQPEDSYSRTLLVYLAGDNNLSYETDEKIESMVKGWSGEGGNLIIYQDKSNTVPQLLEVYRDNGVNYTQVIQTYEEENSADPTVLARIVGEVVRLYPADSYGLIFFSHASGWLPSATLTAPRSMGMDGDTEMELLDFAEALPGHVFDFIILETCFSAGIELAYELRDKTDYILGSSAEIVSPGFREIYARYMDYLFKQEADLTGFARKAFEWVSAQSGVFQSGTLSLIRTASLPVLADWLSVHIQDLDISEQVDDIQHFDRYSYRLFFDMEDYYSRLVKESDRETLSGLIGDCIVYKAATPYFMYSSSYQGFVIDQHSGFTTYILQDEFPYLNEQYQEMSWYKAVYP